MKDADEIATGMAVDLWERPAENLEPESEYVCFDSLRDPVVATTAGEIDVAVTNLTITQRRAEFVNFTHPWFDAGLRVMVAEEQSSGIGAVLRGLSSAGHLETYGWMVLIVLGATLALTLFDRQFDPNYPKRRREGLAEGFYNVMSVATSGRPPSRCHELSAVIRRVCASRWKALTDGLWFAQMISGVATAPAPGTTRGDGRRHFGR